MSDSYINQQLAVLLQALPYVRDKDFVKNLPQEIRTTELTLQNQQFIDYLKLNFNTQPQAIEKKQRVYMDGCFDLMHFGHYNAIRQAKELGYVLICGVISTEAIRKDKGPNILELDERLALAKSCKWVDEVVVQETYNPTIEILDKVGASHVVHGDDMILNENGEDAYTPFRKAGRLLTIKRTEGISTTDIVGRLLTMSKEHFINDANMRRLSEENPDGISATNVAKIQETHTNTGEQIQQLAMSTTKRISLFSTARQTTQKDIIVYVDGVFDILHHGHLEVLRLAKEQGTYLIVGLYDDNFSSKRKNGKGPVFNLQERMLNVLAQKYVDEVIIGAPQKITEKMLKQYQIKLVIHGQYKLQEFENIQEDPYQIPKEQGIFKVLDSKYQFNSDTLINRIIQNRQEYFQFQKRYVIVNKKKQEKEMKYQMTKDYTIQEQ